MPKKSTPARLERKGGYPAGPKTASQMKPPPASITKPKRPAPK